MILTIMVDDLHRNIDDLQWSIKMTSTVLMIYINIVNFARSYEVPKYIQKVIKQ